MEALAAEGQHLFGRLAGGANQKDTVETPLVVFVGASELIPDRRGGGGSARLLSRGLSRRGAITDPGMRRESLSAILVGQPRPCPVGRLQNRSGVGKRASARHRGRPGARTAVRKHFSDRFFPRKGVPAVEIGAHT